jgi:aspartyl-tRNA(Asn)/glutamyl-tRNA(Gln) amidotransferase subunit B
MMTQSLATARYYEAAKAAGAAQAGGQLGDGRDQQAPEREGGEIDAAPVGPSCWRG